MSKKRLALILGITANMTFAAGCLLQAVRRHSPNLGADIILFTEGPLPEQDEALLRGLGAELRVFTPIKTQYCEIALRQFTLMALARLDGLLLLSEYEKVVWLDVDIAVQGDIAPLFEFGPYGVALEDPLFTGGTTQPASINVDGATSFPDLDMNAPNLNSGVLVLHDTIPDPKALHALCMERIRTHGIHLRYMDQALVNMLAHILQRQNPALVARIPNDRFNCHAVNPNAQHAPIVHFYGPFKPWDDGLTRCAFPEWARDYARWLGMGGTPWTGDVDNTEFLNLSAFSMLRRLYDNFLESERVLAGLQDDLREEQLHRARLEKTLHKIAGNM